MSDQPLPGSSPENDSSQDASQHAHPHATLIEAPPTTLWGILARLGPGLILVGSIVGSGELIATPNTAAKAGFSLLWLILLGTVIKVFVQVEFGRFAIVNGLPSLWGMNELPGPTGEVGVSNSPTTVRGNWLTWYWLAMMIMSLAQLGGIVGGVGQALAISVPITAAGKAYNTAVDRRTVLNLKIHEAKYLREHPTVGRQTPTEEEIAAKQLQMDELVWQIDGVPAEKFTSWQPDEAGQVARPQIPAADQPLFDWLVIQSDRNGDGQLSQSEFDARPAALKAGVYDDRIWASLVTVVTAILLIVGRYGFIESASIVFVASFTFITIVNLVLLQMDGTWAVTWEDLKEGFSFHLPEKVEGGTSAVATALFTFGIIGVGANELIQYPSWCLEKGYARFTGPRDDSPEWAERARGWMNVMGWDAWLSMAVYTFATIAFYLIGASVLGRMHLIPAGTDMIRTLAAMYEPVFGTWTQMLFFFGAFAVLYSTFFVANAGHARVGADAVGIFTRAEPDEVRHLFWIRFFSGLLPCISFAFYFFYPNPTLLVLIGAAMQAFMLPMLVAAALYFRYYRNDDRLAPGLAWDICLWVSGLAMTIAGGAAVYFSIVEIGGMFK